MSEINPSPLNGWAKDHTLGRCGLGSGRTVATPSHWHDIVGFNWNTYLFQVRELEKWVTEPRIAESKNSERNGIRTPLVATPVAGAAVTVGIR